MGRYDWPAPHGGDDPIGRTRHLTQLRPTINPSAIAGLTVRPRTATRRARAVPHNEPVGNQNLWFPIGPSVMVNGQAGGHPNVAGRIRDLTVEPTTGRRIYAASATGGVWFSADRGDTWTPLDEFQQSDRTDVGNLAAALACGAIYVRFGAAADGSQDDVWVGTGEQTLTSEALQGSLGGGPTGLPGGQVAGIGLLHRAPGSVAWAVVKGAAATADADTLRGESFYRIVADPGNDRQLVAGTTKGLYVSPVGAPWTKVASYPSATDMQPLDVVLTRHTAPNRVRIWVAVSTGVLVAEFTGAPASAINPAGLVFRAVALPTIALAPPNADGSPSGGTRVQLATDGTTVYALGRRAAVAGDKNPPAQVWSIAATAALAPLPAPVALTASVLTGVPDDLFSDEQSYYDMCIAVHPAAPLRLYVGGAVLHTPTGSNAAIYRCTLAGTTLTATPIGEGVHPDVHVLRIGPVAPPEVPPLPAPPRHAMWVGCDGGVFRSNRDGDPDSFGASNDGLAVLEPGYVASHPTNPGIVAAGFQDNGTAVRVGDTMWEQRLRGDGGGVVFDPANDNRFYAQYIYADWSSSDSSGIRPVLRRRRAAETKLKTSETVEKDASLFYTGADSVVHGGDTHLAFGTDRVWYSRDWGKHWMTLPSAKDPRDDENTDLGQDVLRPIGVPGKFSDTVTTLHCCTKQHEGKAFIGDGIIAVKFSTLPANPAPGAALTLRVLALFSHGLVWMTGTRAAGAAGAFTWAKPFVEQPVQSPPVADQVAFTAGSPLPYLPAASFVSDVAVHDPTQGPLGSCYVTTVGEDVDYAGPPAVSVPRDTLYFFDGKDKWFPTGLRLDLPLVGKWGANIRVTAPALGVVVDPDDKNTVYVATSVGVVRGALTMGGTVAVPTYEWAWRQFVNGLPEAAVQDLSIHKYGTVKLLRAALQARGVWETDVANPVSPPLTYLRAYPTDTRRLLPTQLSGPTRAGERNPVPYDNSPDIVVEPAPAVRTTPLTEAALADLRAPGGVPSPPRMGVSDRHPKVHVLVHHRASTAATSAQVRVALLRHAVPANGVVALGGLWPVLVTAGQAGTSPALPDNWTKAASTLTLSLDPNQPVEPRTPRAVTFNLDLTGDSPGDAILLLAVVMSTTNRITAADLQLNPGTAATADQLVTSSPHVAARSIVIR